MPRLIIIAHNIRSTHNIGAIFRTADGFGVEKIILSGYSPYPTVPGDTRLPHIHEKLTRQIHKSAIGAETLVPFEYSLAPPIEMLKNEGWRIVGLEQSASAHMLTDYTPPEKIALIIGEEVHGIDKELLGLCEDIVEIPMRGKKESFNVSVATGIALYALLK